MHKLYFAPINFYGNYIYRHLVLSHGADYVFSEQRLYLKPGGGRWEYRSPSASPFWYLHSGRAKVKFWADAKNDCWQGKDVAMEGKIFVEKFVLIPVDMKQMRQLSIKDENNITD